MASVNRRQLISKTLTASEAGDKTSLEQFQSDFNLYVAVTSLDAGTVDVDLEHSADGTNWLTAASATQVSSAPAREAIAITATLLPNVRANVTLAGGATSSDVEVALYYDKRK